MDVELQATCSALGYLEDNVYVKEPDCLETVKDLIRFLRRDTDTCDIRRQLGHAKIVQNDLVPLFKGYHNDKPLFETVIKLLVNLTQPVADCFNNQIPDEKTLRNFCLEIESQLQDTKEAFVDDDLFGVLTDKIKETLKLDWDSRREEDYLQLERLFILVRNVLMIPPDPDRELRTDDDATIHDQILWAAHTSGLEDLILYVASSDRERSRLCMHVMEIVSLMFREHEVETLAFAGVQRSMSEKEKDQRELEKAREKEKVIKKASILKYSARHSRFGGTFVMQNVKSITESDVIYHKPVCEVERFSYDNEKVPKKKSKNLAPVKTYNNKRRSTLSMRLSLKEFCVQFLMHAYNPLMRAVKDALTRSRSEDHDETYYLWAMRYFMEFCRLHCKRVDLVSETMSMATFHYIYIQLCTYYENVMMGKAEEAKAWGRRSHLALMAYQELLKTLDSMTKSRDEQIRESAKVIQGNVFYMVEYRDIFVTLLKKFKESKSSRSYLRDLVESTHIFLKMLETFSKGTRNLVVQKKGKAKGGKKKQKPSKSGSQDGPPQMSEEELTELWENDLSERLLGSLQGDEEIPTDVSPFDAASDISVDEQRVEAMLRVQSCLRDKNVGEAIAVLRAAREVWPEGDGFGSDTGLVADELETLRTIFMTDLPRPASQRTEQDEGEEEEEEEVNEEMQDEMDDVRRNEQCFDFKLFINDFAHPYVIKNYATLLNEFTDNSDAVNHCVVKMLHRVGHDLGYVGMLFQASIFHTFSKLFFGPLAKLDRYKEIRTYATWVVRQFSQVAAVNNKVFVDILFWKSKTEALAITGDYDFRPKSKAKVTWSEHDAEELRCLYEKYKDMTHPEMDTAELILQELSSDHSRMQVLRELKNQGLISSAKDVKRKSNHSNKWTEDQIQELRDIVELHRDSDHPIATIMGHLSFEKTKPTVIRQILKLGLVADKSELKRKPGTKRSGGGRKKRGGSSSSDGGGDDSDNSNGSSDDSDEGERLFPKTNRRDKKKKSSRDSDDDDDDDDDGDYHEGDSDDDDVDQDVMLLVRQSVSGVADYVTRLVENGYKDQIAWIRGCLRNVAEDRDEGMCIPTPLVPLTEENETAMEDEIFLVFLRSIGITSPANEQEMFWRIPKEFSAADLRTIQAGLEHDESGVASGAEAVQAVVDRVFPGGVTSTSSTGRREERRKKDKKKKKDKKNKDKDKKTTKNKIRVKKSKEKILNSDDNDDDEDGDKISDLSDLSDKNSISDDDNDGNDVDTNSSSAMRRAVVRREKDDDTSDSGLDPEIEAREQELIRKEKEKNTSKGGGSKTKKGKLSSQKARTDLLKKIQEKRNKRKRRDNDVTPNSQNQQKSDSESDSSNEEEIRKGKKGKDLVVSSSSKPDNKPSDRGRVGKSKGKRLRLLASDSDSDLDLDLNLKFPVSNKDGDDNDNNDDGDGRSSALSDQISEKLSSTKAKKRVLLSESEEENENEEQVMNKVGEGKKDMETESNLIGDEAGVKKASRGTKRLKLILSDDETDGELEKKNDDDNNDNNNDDIVDQSSTSKVDTVVDEKGVEEEEDSDKENQRSRLSSQDKTDTLDDSLHLRFDESSEDEKMDQDNCHDKLDDAEDDDNVGRGKIAARDTFPATLLTQTPGSDDDDDHVPLSTVMKKRKAVISDEEDE